MLFTICNQTLYLYLFHCTVYFKHVLFCPEDGNRLPKMLNLYIYIYIYILMFFLKCNESVCHSMVDQLFKLSTKDTI